MGAEGAGGSIQVVVGLSSRRPLTVTLRRSDRAGRDHLGKRWAWPWSVFADTSINMLNEILVFDLSLATGLYALTIYAGSSYGYPDVVVSAEALQTSATERRAPDWTRTPALV